MYFSWGRSQSLQRREIYRSEEIYRILNPVIIKRDAPYETEEGCLSLDGIRKTIRYQNIEVEYYDFSWKKQRQKLKGWTAQICQHEIDHLEGRII